MDDLKYILLKEDDFNNKIKQEEIGNEEDLESLEEKILNINIEKKA